MDITNKSVVELKALAYDELAKIQQAQKNIEAINTTILKKTQVEPVTQEVQAQETTETSTPQPTEE